MTKKDIGQKIIIELYDKPKRWGELIKATGVSDPTLIKYLNKLIKLKKIEKFINDEGKIAYRININQLSSLNKQNIEDSIKQIKKKIEIIRELSRKGLFSKGMTEKDMFNFLKSPKARLINMDKKHIKNIDELDYGLLNSFLIQLNFLKPNMKVKAKLKIEKNPNKIITEIKNNIKKLQIISNKL